MINRQMQMVCEDDLSELDHDPKRSRDEALEQLLLEMKDAIQSAMEAAAARQRDIQAAQKN